jgi:hypothetical protein
LVEAKDEIDCVSEASRVAGGRGEGLVEAEDEIDCDRKQVEWQGGGVTAWSRKTTS